MIFTDHLRFFHVHLKGRGMDHRREMDHGSRAETTKTYSDLLTSSGTFFLYETDRVDFVQKQDGIA